MAKEASTASATGTNDQTAERRWLVLNAVVLKHMTTTAAVADAIGLPVEQVEAALDALEAEDAVARVELHVLPTETGVAELKADADSRYRAVRDDPGMTGWLDQFDPVNRRFLEVTTAWQTLPVGTGRVPNDHSDPAYDAQVVSRLEKLVAKAARLIHEMAERVPRFTRYRERLDAALVRVDQGETRYVSDPLVDSVHTVWFEMHEDILTVLGRERTEQSSEQRSTRT